MSFQHNLDTVQPRELLIDASVDHAIVRAHRSVLAWALSQTVGAWCAKENQTLVESRLETAIASQTAKIAARIADHTWKAVGFYVGFVTFVVSLAVALIKLS